MTIRLLCPSGHRLSVSARHAGKWIRCPRCNERVCVPEPGKGEPSRDEAAGQRAEQEKGQPDAADPQKRPPVKAEGKAKAKRPPRRKPKPQPKPAARPPRAKPAAATPTPPLRQPPRLPPARQDSSASEEKSKKAKPPARKPIKPSAEPPPPSGPKRVAELAPKARPPRRWGRRGREQSKGEPKLASPTKPELNGAREDLPEPVPVPPPRSKSPRRSGPRLMPPDVYRPDPGKIASIKWLALLLALVVGFSVLPAAWRTYLNLETAPGWARAVLLLGAVQLVYVLWMLSAPDWASVWVVMLVFAAVSTLYGMATALGLFFPQGKPMFWGMEEVRDLAGHWCGAVLLFMSLATYLSGRTAVRWRRALELELAGKRGQR